VEGEKSGNQSIIIKHRLEKLKTSIDKKETKENKWKKKTSADLISLGTSFWHASSLLCLTQ
jgi:hypothetical protein